MRRQPVWVWVVAGLGFLVLVCVAFGVGSLFVPDGEPSARPAVNTSAPGGLASEQWASALAAAGIPPEPGPEVWAAFIADLNAIDPLIVHGKEEKAVDRARNQCSSVLEWPNDQERLVGLVILRFTAPSHPGGFGEEKSARILVAVRKHICPSY